MALLLMQISPTEKFQGIDRHAGRFTLRDWLSPSEFDPGCVNTAKTRSGNELVNGGEQQLAIREVGLVDHRLTNGFSRFRWRLIRWG